jgi:RNA polymerase sigma-70 factor (ECF subfamily)
MKVPPRIEASATVSSSPVAPESAALARLGLVKAADYRDQERHKSLEQGEIAVTITTDRANLVLKLFEAYYKRVYCFSRKSLAPSAAEDIAQEVFTRLLQVKALEEKTITSSYLIKIADNLIKRGYNKDQRKNRYIDSQRDDAIRDIRRHKPIEAKWTSSEITSALASLPVHERDAVRLVVCDGLSYDEASASLGVPVSTVNNWKYRGVNKLKERAREMEMKRTA